MRRRRLGQHYLVDPDVVRCIVEYAKVKPTERVLEIGTGRGALTVKLAGLGKSLEGYEVDEENYRRTRDLVGSKAVVHHGDAFAERPEFDVLVASLPYSESARFVEWLAQADYDRAVVLLQSDFVEKITAPPGSREYRAVSALAQVSSEVRVLEPVGRRSFSPPPKVDSVVVSFAPRRRVPKEEALRIKKLFSLRRRQVASVLSEFGISASARYGTRRVFSLTPQEVHELCATAPPH